MIFLHFLILKKLQSDIDALIIYLLSILYAKEFFICKWCNFDLWLEKINIKNISLSDPYNTKYFLNIQNLTFVKNLGWIFCYAHIFIYSLLHQIIEILKIYFTKQKWLPRTF